MTHLGIVGAEEVALLSGTGAQVEEGKKSVAYTITMRSSDSTLTDEEADGAVKKILKALEKIGVTLRV